ncbi:MAG: hypothetical protein ACRDPQ_03510 [Nocardioidaceae bacterium]
MIAGRCSVVLSDVDTDSRTASWSEACSEMRRRLADLEALPAGCRVEIHVGHCWPIPEAVRLIAKHGDRLDITVIGSAARTPRWLDALADPDGDLSSWPRSAS